jgi:hypothetical protein
VVQVKGDRIVRHSSAWAQMRQHLETRANLRVLDLGPTSPSNIIYLTSLGHSVYTANLVEEASQPEWWHKVEGQEQPIFDVERFVADQLDFTNRRFDVVLFWDTADYMPPELPPRVFKRVHELMESEGTLLAFFHARSTGPGTEFHRFHLTSGNNIEMQPVGNFPIRQALNTRSIEKLLSPFSGFRFFLSRDNNREAIAFK